VFSLKSFPLSYIFLSLTLLVPQEFLDLQIVADQEMGHANI